MKDPVDRATFRGENSEGGVTAARSEMKRKSSCVGTSRETRGGGKVGLRAKLQGGDK